MTSQPLVSVIIIFFNSEKFLPEAIESVFAQTYDNWELLLVDDGSMDASTSIAKQCAHQYASKVRYLEHAGHQNKGACAARNLGVCQAQGKYIALLDSDDVWLPQKLERQVPLLESQPQAAMVYGASQYWHSWTGVAEDMGRDHIPDLGVASDTLYDPPSLCTLLYPLGNGTAPCPSDLLIRRDAIIQIGGFEEDFRGERQLYEDQAFLAKMYLEHSVFVSSECWDRYRIHSDSCVSVVTNAGQYESVRLFFLNWLEAYLLKRGIKDERIWTAFGQAIAPYRQPAAVGKLHSSLRSPDWRETAWSLRLGGGNLARLVLPPRQVDQVRIEIDKLQSTTGFDVQLNWTRLRMKANDSYRLHFRARADCSRRIAFGAAQAHEPWGGLGLYKSAELTSEWQSFDEEFVALSDDPNARILFDVGNSEIPVELADVSLQSVSTGEAIEPNHSESAMQADSLGDPQFGQLRRLTPISSDWGWDRGLPIDRYYIEKFLAREASSIRGHVLEICDNSYTVRFGGSNVEKSDVLHVAEGNPMATIVADLTAAPHIPSASFDCILLIQTLQFIYDVRSAIQTLYRILKPGGILLATFPGISQTYDRTWGGGITFCWNFTPLSARRLFQEAFPEAHVKIEAFGNVLAAISFLHGLAKEELRQEELDYYEPGYEVTIAVKAMKPLGTSRLSTDCWTSSIELGAGARTASMADTLPRTASGSSKGIILTYHRIVEASPDPWALCVSPHHFAEHMEVLRKHARVVPLQQLAPQIQGKTPSGAWVALTFDDGYADNLHHAKPLLERYEVPATVFLTTGYIGAGREFWSDDLEKVFLLPGILPDTLRLHIDDQKYEWNLGSSVHYSQESYRQWQNWRGWDEAPSRRHSLYHEVRHLLQPLPENIRRTAIDELLRWGGVQPEPRPTHRVLSTREAVDLDQGKLIEVGAHTVTHPRLSQIPLSRQQEEIYASKAHLEELLGHPVTSFAYPFGSKADYTADTRDLVHNCGFSLACSTVMGAVHANTDPLQLPRIAVQNWDGDEFERQLFQWYKQ